MAKHVVGPGGGALPTRSDEKMGNQRTEFWHALGDDFDPSNAMKAWKKMLKRYSRKKRRQRDRTFE